MSHAYLTIECKSCKTLGNKTVVRLKYLGIYTKGEQYDISGCPLFFKIPCHECNQVSSYERSDAEVTLLPFAPPHDFHDMV